MTTKTISLTSWNNYPSQVCTLHRPERFRQFFPSQKTNIARGMGRSYGDAPLNEGGDVFLSERLNRILSFNQESGVLRAEAGTTLKDILNLIVPHGWFLPVTPGTQFVSLGGAVAADVHGKNHHCDGSFGNFVAELLLATPIDGLVNCSPNSSPDLFWATVGGMGLTGFIVEVELRLKPIASSYILTRHHAAENLTALFDLFTNPEQDAPYSVAWIDCLSSGSKLGRGILMTGDHARPDQLPEEIGTQPFLAKEKKIRSVPFNFPGWALNSISVNIFNNSYYYTQARKREPFISDNRSFFYPLDNILNWNRMYGTKGFIQYQCVIPEPRAFDAIHELLDRITKSRNASFLAVLKRMGAAGQGMLSFPTEGYTLALDMGLGNPELFRLLDHLDEIVVRHGGRVYLAKDARLNAYLFQTMYPRYKEWLAVKNRVDPNNILSSSLSRRLLIGSEI